MSDEDRVELEPYEGEGTRLYPEEERRSEESWWRLAVRKTLWGLVTSIVVAVVLIFSAIYFQTLGVQLFRLSWPALIGSVVVIPTLIYAGLVGLGLASKAVDARLGILLADILGPVLFATLLLYGVVDLISLGPAALALSSVFPAAVGFLLMIFLHRGQTRLGMSGLGELGVASFVYPFSEVLSRVMPSPVDYLVETPLAFMAAALIIVGASKLAGDLLHIDSLKGLMERIGDLIIHMATIGGLAISTPVIPHTVFKLASMALYVVFLILLGITIYMIYTFIKS